MLLSFVSKQCVRSNVAIGSHSALMPPERRVVRSERTLLSRDTDSAAKTMISQAQRLIVSRPFYFPTTAGGRLRAPQPTGGM